MNDWPTFTAQIKKAVGEKNYSKAIKTIKNSINPQFAANFILTHGFLRNKKRAKIINNIFERKLQSSTSIIIRTSWGNRFNFFPQPPSGISSEIQNIHQFLSIRGNPYSAFDFFKLIHGNKLNLNNDSILNYIWQVGWHRGLNIQKIFAEISNPSSNGDLTQIQNESYRLLFYPIGYPRHSGRSEKYSLLLNNDWISCSADEEEEDENTHPILPRQVTEEMEKIEDKSNQLDIEIARNRNIYRLLLFGGPKALQASQVAPYELDAIYGGKGDFILTAMENEEVSKALYPVLLKRLKDRAIELYIRKVHKSRKLSMQLEHILPAQRTKYMRERSTQWIKNEFSTLEAKEIDYPTEKVYMLEKFVQVYSPNYLNSIEFKTLLLHLRNPQNTNIKLTYHKALCIYAGALLLHELLSANIIDPIISSSVKTATEIGITDVEKHGHLHVLMELAETLKKSKIKKGKFFPIDIFVHEISGLFFDLDIEKVNYITATGALFARTLGDLDKDSEPAFMYCQVGGGRISLSLTSMLPFEFDLTSYNIYKGTK